MARLPVLLQLIAAALGVTAVELTVSTKGGNASSPLLYGLMFEDINHSGDGGIYGQLLQNNGFQGENATLTAYSGIGGVELSVDTENPLSKALHRSLKVSVPSGTTGMAGFSNSGYLGVPVNEDRYRSAFWIKGEYNGPITMSLVGIDSRNVYASRTLLVNSRPSTYTYHETLLESSQSYENNTWILTFDAESVAGSALSFDLVQLYPSTYHDRPNGLRKDVAEFLEQTKPSYLRFPGGNNVQGDTIETRWKWNETIGPLETRPGHQGTWTYPNTDGLGLMEYMQWCDDMKMEPLLVIWSGLTHKSNLVTGDALEPFVEEAMNELEFLLGDVATTWGSLRAKYGHPEPYKLNYLQIGNEDQNKGGCDSYPSRFMSFYTPIHAKYPSLRILASVPGPTCLPEPLPVGVYADFHIYLGADGFVKSFDMYDNRERGPENGEIVGEYACRTDNANVKFPLPAMLATVAEAVFLIGLERNSDYVKMSSYAPLLAHFGMEQWVPDLFGFDSTFGSMTGSTSFWAQVMFSTNRGDTILPVTSDSGFGPVYWVASTKARKEFFVKLANYSNTTQAITVKIPAVKCYGASGKAELTTLSGPEYGTNSPGNITIRPAIQAVSGDPRKGVSFDLPAYGVAVLQVT